MDLISNAADLGASFRKNRLKLGLTQSDIAERTGYRRQTIADLEAGGNVGVHVLMAGLAAIGKGLGVVDSNADGRPGKRTKSK